MPPLPQPKAAQPKAAPAPRILEVDASHEGQRIDNFLMTSLKGVPRSHIYRVLRTGEVRVNKGRIKPTYRVQEGDLVRIPPIHTAEPGAAPNPGTRVLDLISRSIIYEDKGLIIINKPPGIAVHGGSGLSYGVIEALRIARLDAPDLELVHRLDRETSGCLMIAKKRSVLRGLHDLLRGDREDGGAVDKRYLALVQGRWEGGRQTVDASLLKNQLSSGERIVRVSDTGKASTSLFQPQAVYAQASLVEVRPLTGRTHQIRVHAAHIDHPIAGDDKYGNEDFNKRMAALGLRRLFLHAHSLSFELPDTGQRISVSAPLDDELKAVLQCVSQISHE